MIEAIVPFLVNHPEWGWVLVLGFAAEQLFAPWETKTKKLVSNIEGKIENVEQGQKAQMTVIRALARTEEKVDTKKVDEYLIENGAEPDDFIMGDGGEQDG